MKLLPKFRANDHTRRSNDYSNLIRQEAKIGGRLFGPVPTGHQREFFCLDDRTWIWHEQWTDTYGNVQSIQTRYEMRSDGVLKIQNGQQYQSLTQEEAINLFRAIRLYVQRVMPTYGVQTA